MSYYIRKQFFFLSLQVRSPLSTIGIDTVKNILFTKNIYSLNTINLREHYF